MLGAVLSLVVESRRGQSQPPSSDSVADEDGDVAPDTSGEVLRTQPGTVEDQVRSFVELLASRGLVTFAT
jgi:hypothetical protein